MSSIRSYGCYNLEIVSKKLVIPLKLYTTIETEPKLSLKQGKLNKETGSVDEIKTIKAIMTDKKTIKEIVSWSGNDTFVQKDGKLVELDEKLKNLIKQDETRRKDKTIEFLGLYSKDKLGWNYFNGKQFVTEVGSKMKNQILMKENAIYSCLYSILKDKFMLVRFFSRSGQELGALFSDEDSGRLRISGLFYDKILKQFPKTGLKSEVSESSIRGVEKLMNKLSTTPEPEYTLDWKEYYQMCIENSGIKEFDKKVKQEIKDTGDQELSALLEGLV